MSENQKSPWRMFLPLLAVVTLFAGWSVYWFIASTAARSIADTQRQALADQGFTLACGRESWGGYPFRFEFTCDVPVLTLANGASVALVSLQVIAQAYDPMHAVLLANGPTQVTEANGQARTIRHDRAVASIVAVGNGLPRITAEIPNLSTDEGLAMAMLRLAARPAEGGKTDVAVTAETMSFTQAGKPTLAADESQLLGVFDPATRRLAISDLHATTGALKLWGTGDVGIDAENKPDGIITLQTNDMPGFLAFIAPYQPLTAQQQQLVTTAFRFMGSKLPVTAKQGQLNVGPLKVADLRPLF